MIIWHDRFTEILFLSGILWEFMGIFWWWTKHHFWKHTSNNTGSCETSWSKNLSLNFSAWKKCPNHMSMCSEPLFNLLYPLFTLILLQTPIYSLPALLTDEVLFPPQIKVVTLRPAGSLDVLNLYLNAKFSHIAFIYN